MGLVCHVPPGRFSENGRRGICPAGKDVSRVRLRRLCVSQLDSKSDIHDQYIDLLRLFEYGGYLPQTNSLLMGNYVDYGKQNLETMCLLLAYKIKYPENFFLLRGNHKNAMTNRIYGLHDECKRRYNVRVWKMFSQCFNCLLTAALMDEKILRVHGGLSPDLHNLDQIRNLLSHTVVPDSGLLCDLHRSDPSSDIQGWRMNERAVSYIFGPDKVLEFLARNDLDLIFHVITLHWQLT